MYIMSEKSEHFTIITAYTVNKEERRQLRYNKIPHGIHVFRQTSFKTQINLALVLTTIRGTSLVHLRTWW